MSLLQTLDLVLDLPTGASRATVPGAAEGLALGRAKGWAGMIDEKGSQIAAQPPGTVGPDHHDADCSPVYRNSAHSGTTPTSTPKMRPRSV